MRLSQIELLQFRSHKKELFEFDPDVTLISGINGSGKTNILEAIHVLLTGSSFRAQDVHLGTYETNWWRLSGLVDDIYREIRYQRDNSPPKQIVLKNNKKRFHNKDRLPVVLFEPHDTLFIYGSPSRRRADVDTMIASIIPGYKTTQNRYERAVRQRNNILKDHRNSSMINDALFAWDVMLAEYGANIVAARQRFIDRIDSKLAEYYSAISGNTDTVHMGYIQTIPSQEVSEFHKILLSKYKDDKLRASTTSGPHKDDFKILLNKEDAKLSASRGEVRSLMLAVKLAFADILEEISQKKPLILLDDVYSELDSQRKQRLSETLKTNQTIITDTHAIDGINTIHLN